jgi:anti-sigma B factor antagonist
MAARERGMSDPSAASVLTFEIERTGTTAVVRCHGQLIASAIGAFYDRIKQLIPDSKRIILDLTDVARMDSTGLGGVVRLYVSARSAGCSLELINMGKQVRELLGLTNLMSVLALIGEHNIRFG